MFKIFLAALLLATPLSAVTIFGLRSDNHLVSFDSATPGTATDLGAVTGVVGGETIVGMDLRPLDGQLYLISVDAATFAHTYTLNSTTAAATLVGSTASGVALLSSSATYGVSFNPTVDRIRVVNSVGENIRLNPLNGALAGNDTDLNPGTPSIVAVAYDRSFAGTPFSTVYVIDNGTDQLLMLGGVSGTPSPNGGTLTLVGSLGVSITGDAGLDIDPQTGTAFMAATVGATTSLFTVNLTTGAATLVGSIGAGTMALKSIALQQSANVIPSFTLPTGLTTAQDTPLTLNGTTGVAVADSDAGVNSLHFQLVVTGGTVTMALVSGLTITVGTGFDDLVFGCTGVITQLNTAVSNMTFRPAAGFNGIATITMALGDNGASGFGGPGNSVVVLNIAVGTVPSGSSGGGGKDESKCSAGEGAGFGALICALAALLAAARLRRRAM